MPDSRCQLALAANAGWYTLPTMSVSYPYGILDSPVTDSMLAQALQHKLVLLLGSKDTDMHCRHLRKSAEANQQGELWPGGGGGGAVLQGM
eukprot:jgi/Chrzof1/12127/Cz06g22070.t1